MPIRSKPTDATATLHKAAEALSSASWRIDRGEYLAAHKETRRAVEMMLDAMDQLGQLRDQPSEDPRCA